VGLTSVAHGCTDPTYHYVMVYQGCHNDRFGPYPNRGGNRTLPQSLDGEGFGLDECAAAARSRGFRIFALQWYGQCFFGSIADVARLPSSNKLPDTSCDQLPCTSSSRICPGYINKIYIFTGAPYTTMKLSEESMSYIRKLYG
jgi:hypothetical protein